MVWARVAAVEMKTNDMSKKMDSTVDRMDRLDAEMLDIRRRWDTLAVLSWRATLS